MIMSPAIDQEIGYECREGIPNWICTIHWNRSRLNIFFSSMVKNPIDYSHVSILLLSLEQYWYYDSIEMDLQAMPVSQIIDI